MHTCLVLKHVGIRIIKFSFDQQKKKLFHTFSIELQFSLHYERIFLSTLKPKKNY